MGHFYSMPGTCGPEAMMTMIGDLERAIALGLRRSTDQGGGVMAQVSLILAVMPVQLGRGDIFRS